MYAIIIMNNVNIMIGGDYMTANQLSVDVISYVSQHESSITNLKLQKVLYYLQGYYARSFGEPLFEDDLEHWPYGPVVPAVYFNYCRFGASPIFVQPNDSLFQGYSRNEKDLIFKVIDVCTTYTARDLVNKSHRETPWKSTPASHAIPFDEIQRYFEDNDPLGLFAR